MGALLPEQGAASMEKLPRTRCWRWRRFPVSSLFRLSHWAVRPRQPNRPGRWRQGELLIILIRASGCAGRSARAAENFFFPERPR